MKSFNLLLAPIVTAVLLSTAGCGNDDGDRRTTPVDTTTKTHVDRSAAPMATDVPQLPDDSLRPLLKQIEQRYPGVTATVRNREVTLTGNVSKDSVPIIVQAVEAIHPGRLVNQLSVKK